MILRCGEFNVQNSPASMLDGEFWEFKSTHLNVIKVEKCFAADSVHGKKQLLDFLHISQFSQIHTLSLLLQEENGGKSKSHLTEYISKLTALIQLWCKPARKNAGLSV